MVIKKDIYDLKITTSRTLGWVGHLVMTCLLHNIPQLLVSEQDARGISPLGIAVGFNRVQAVKELLDQGVDKEQKDKQGNTVLHYAAGLSTSVSFA